MVKKRLIFTLLFDRGYFMLSRNFRLQRVGDLAWLIRNYDFAHTATQIDELVLINVERNPTTPTNFIRHLRQLCEICFIPITAGGGIRKAEDAGLLLANGADKVLINTMAVHQQQELFKIVESYGQQSVVLGVDLKRCANTMRAFVESGSEEVRGEISEHFAYLNELPVGEWMITSIDRDGTGMGYDADFLQFLPNDFSKPLILSGGASKPDHFVVMFGYPQVSALSTAHLFNFVGSGLKHVRDSLLGSGHSLPTWDSRENTFLNGIAENGSI